MIPKLKIVKFLVLLSQQIALKRQKARILRAEEKMVFTDGLEIKFYSILRLAHQKLKK